MTLWRLSHRADIAALPLADRHYNRQKIGSPQFVPPGRCLVLLHGEPASALWVTSWPFGEYVKYRWPGAWVCSCFRREDGAAPASVLVTSAVAATVSALAAARVLAVKKVARTQEACYL